MVSRSSRSLGAWHAPRYTHRDRSSGDGSRVVRERLAQSPTDDALGRDPEHLWIKAGPDLGAAGVQDLGVAPDFDAPHTPGVHRGDVVDDEGDLGVSQDVTVLLALGEIVAADIDGVVLLVVAESRRHHVRHSVRTNGRETPEADTGCEVFTFVIAEDAHVASFPQLRHRRTTIVPQFYVPRPAEFQLSSSIVIPSAAASVWASATRLCPSM